MAKSRRINTDAKGRRLITRAYIVTMGATVLITLLTAIFLVDTRSCGSVERGLMVVGGMTALLFLVSVAAVGVGVWKAVSSVAERLAVVVAYGAMMLASFVVITCGLMVVFNC